MRICYLSKKYKILGSAGNKAKTDIETVLEQMGAHNIGLKDSLYENKLKGFRVSLTSVMKAFFCLKKGDVLVIQYPFKKFYTILCNLAHLRGSKVVTVIHDLGSFRRRKLSPEKEVTRLNHSDYIIAHNGKMKKWLLDNGSKSQIGCLELFDYLSSTNADESVPPLSPDTVVYAGALNARKNPFLYDLGDQMENYRLNLYGGGFDEAMIKNPEKIHYKGFVPSDELIASVDGHFGLVWDGNSIYKCDGVNGEYLRYNNPHKTSLYIRCLLPVIIWKEAALASFIGEHGIGICIGSLTELDDIIGSMTMDEYMKLKDNVKKINDRISHGYYIKHALEEACRCLSAPK